MRIGGRFSLPHIVLFSVKATGAGKMKDWHIRLKPLERFEPSATELCSGFWESLSFAAWILEHHMMQWQDSRTYI